MSYDLGHLSAPITLADQAYSTLRAAIVAGELKQGAKLTDRGLADSLAVSPTPIREAIRRLEQDRLVERTGPRSVRVAIYSHDERAEIAQAADSLKAVLARIAATKITEAELDDLAQCLEAADTEREFLYNQIAEQGRTAEVVRASAAKLIALLREFHATINRASRNDILLHVLHTVEAFGVDTRQKALQEQIARDGSGPQGRYHQHRQILEALRAHDPDRVESLMLAHSHGASIDLLSLTT
ncbi:GntR family transcriptional regulator [Rhodococcus opacus]|uniref:GntR family transcriptional regulator n=1 Tax=Rhodococcus opacus TaxID=37919 RepID=A0A2S8JA63_RHOOP|nr:GntR family transcriptional regulator [Rhodococcus opacus]PQP23522.1 GntR family transcriptional regulator [Rhodococcus opacus]